MKFLTSITAFLLIGLMAYGQETFNNEGNIKIHEGGQMGFFGNLINDGDFSQNQGLVGFYGDFPNQVSGNNPTTFNNIEFANQSGVLLNTSMNVSGTSAFFFSNVITRLPSTDVYLNYLEDANAAGQADDHKVIGYAAATNKSTFGFPIGDVQQLRPLVFTSAIESPFAQAAYFFANPSGSNAAGTDFNVLVRENILQFVSNNEFWILQNTVENTVSLSWNSRSGLAAIAPNLESITVVGWNLNAREWVALPIGTRTGTVNDGFIVTNTFDPSLYGALTFGVLNEVITVPEPGNYFVSPNEDGINDFFVIDEIEDSPNNFVAIYNKFGQKVFEMNNYSNEFRGFANTGTLILNEDEGLPEGVYYYTANLHDLNLEFTGFFFLDR